jgi:hypothetical protein
VLRAAVALLVAAAAVGCVSAAARAPEKRAVEHWRLKPSGIGPLRLGMSERRARALAPGLRVRRRQFCDYWTVPRLHGVSLVAEHERGGLSAVSISTYSTQSSRGHGARGVEVGDRLRELKRKFGKRLRFVKRYPGLRSAFYRIYTRHGHRKALEFTVDTRTHRVKFEQAGYRGEFYYTDGSELCG